MTQHEQIMICAARYALGRQTYIVGFVCDYIKEHINGMSDVCKQILIHDIENPIRGDYGSGCDKYCWMQLLDELRGDVE